MDWWTDLWWTDGPSSNNNHDCLCITLWLILGMVLLISNAKVVTFFPHDMIEFWDNRQFRSGVLGKGGEEKEEAVEDGAHSGGGGIWRWQLIRWRKIHTRWRGTDVGDWLLAARRHHDRASHFLSLSCTPVPIIGEKKQLSKKPKI